MLFSPGTKSEKQGSKWFASLLHLRINSYSSNVYYASFMLTQHSAEELNQNDNDMSCVTGVTGTTLMCTSHIMIEYGIIIRDKCFVSRIGQVISQVPGGV